MVKVSYEKLWKTLSEKGMEVTQLQEKANLTEENIAKLKNNENVSSDVLVGICIALECGPSDVVDIISIE